MEEKTTSVFRIYIDQLEKVFVTGEEFEKILQDIMQKYQEKGLFIRYRVKDKEENEYIYGEIAPNNRSVHQDTKEYEDGYRLETFLWQDEEIISMKECVEFFDAFWNSTLCDSICGIIAYNTSKCKVKCDETLKLWKSEKKNVAFFMIDLDKFKEVNTKYNHQVGTNVISEFSRVLKIILGNRGILIHQSGDEFNVLYYYETPWEIVALAYELKRKIDGHTFKQASDVELTMAIGVYLLEKNHIDYMEARSKAEAAYDGKNKNTEKQRDSIRIEKDENQISYGNNSDIERELKKAIIRVTSVRNKEIFHNIFLDFISNYVLGIEEEKVQQEINKIVKWINPEQNSNIRCTALNKSWDTKASISNLEVGFAVLHGILRNKSIIEKKVICKIYKENEKVKFNIEINGKNIFVHEETKLNITDLQWDSGVITEESFYETRKRAVLLSAGYDDNITIPEDIFDRIIRVDTRPFLGGALSDLWTAALCELIINMKENSYFTDVFICGEVGKTPKVKDYLNNIELWDTKDGKYSIRYMSRKTFMSESDIIEFKNKFKEHIFECSEKDTIDKLYEICNKGLEKAHTKINNIKENKGRILNRQLEYNNIELGVVHGCKATSIADAFPISLEILRSTALKNKNNYIVDQAGRKLFELMNFRILLEKPKSENLPEYYKYDENELTEYYNNTFGTENGLFMREFNEHDQLKKVIRHIIEAINNPEKRYATRRAILVVPNRNNNNNNDVQYPLGLVSVWIAPRIKNEEVVIDFSYSWRTVEALVGLPESMYASVKFAEELTKEISEKCDTITVKLGSVSYIAYSLHMFLDSQSMNIIRGIINDASI